MFYIFKSDTETKIRRNWPAGLFSIDENYSIKYDQRRRKITMNHKEGITFPYARTKIYLNQFNQIKLAYIKVFTFGVANITDFHTVLQMMELNLP